MKKLAIFLSCLCITVGMFGTQAYGKTEDVAKIQQMINDLPDMQDITEENEDDVIAQLDAIDEEKLMLEDDELLQLDFTKYDAAAFVLSAPAGTASLIVQKTYLTVNDGYTPDPSFSFVNESGEAAVMLTDASGASMCTSLDVEANGAARCVYIYPGAYTLCEEVEGNWNAVMTVNGQTLSGDEVTFEPGRTYIMQIDNRHDQTKEIQTSIVWNDDDNRDGRRPSSAEVTFYVDGSSTPGQMISEAGAWKKTFKILSDNPNAQVTVLGQDFDGYTQTVSGDVQDGFTITYTHTPDKVTVSGSITWNDSDNQYGKRPDIVCVALKANGTILAQNDVTEADGWSYSFVDLYQYEDEGIKIIYSIECDAVENYTVSVNGYNISMEVNVQETESESESETETDVEETKETESKQEPETKETETGDAKPNETKPNGNNTNGTGSNTGNKADASKEGVATADNHYILPMMAMLMASVLVIAGAVIWSVEKRR